MEFKIKSWTITESDDSSFAPYCFIEIDFDSGGARKIPIVFQQDFRRFINLYGLELSARHVSPSYSVWEFLSRLGITRTRQVDGKTVMGFDGQALHEHKFYGY